MFVSTDDPELTRIARRMGVEVLDRPVDLALPDVTLDEVIVACIKQLEQRGVCPDVVLTIQPTSPLVSSGTIDRAVDTCIEGGFDTVLTGVADAHLSWRRDDDGKFVPEYAERVNRQELPESFRETGGVVVARRQTVLTGTRFGAKVGIVEVSKAESVDIDDYFDWWFAEKSLRRRRVCFHIVGRSEVGLGHVYRCLTLADRLIDHEVVFLVNSDQDIAIEMVRRHYHTIRVVEPGGELDAILALGPDLVVNDVLATEKAFIASLGDAGIRTINFEDEGPGSLESDLVINAMYRTHPQRRDGGAHVGVRYCCIRDEFFGERPKPVVDPPRNVLLLFGGTDPRGMTVKLLRWLDAMPGDWKVTVVTGIGFGHADDLAEVLRSMSHPVEHVTDTRVLASYMADADIAVTSAGRTVFELACLGVPTVVVAQHERESRHVFASESLGTIALGESTTVTAEAFQETVGQLLASPVLREKMRRVLLDTDIRSGTDRVIGLIQSVLQEPKP